MKTKWKHIKQKHFFQPYERNAAYKASLNEKYYIDSYNTTILLLDDNEYEIYGTDGIILVCADGTVIDQL